uniref:TSA: Wollemia nobilis Ref_Wollemi_Transcript_18910_1268 transcribed RNA sequence n=1 Tax=Wollemia nobilis TaxID=56998 RepID=A0A0C9RI38_9CONI
MPSMAVTAMWKTAVVLVVTLLASELHAQQLVPALFIFGDSLVDVGNNNHIKLSAIKANFPHNGVDYSGRKATGRFSNGRNSADFLAQKLGLAGSPPPYLALEGHNNSIVQGVNFASGGAGILDENSRGSISVNKQVQYFATVYGNLAAQLGSAKAQNLVAKSLFTVVIGSNDLFSYSKSNSNLKAKYNPEQYINLLVSTLKGQLQRIYNLGARRLVSVGLGPVGCCPSQRSQKSKTGDCIAEVNDLALKFNGAVKSMLEDLGSNLHGLKYSLCKTYGLLSSYIQNPSKYGFTDVADACCGAGKQNARIACLPVVTYCSNRSEYVFWDLYHPTEIVSKMLTDTFFDGSTDQVSPVNVRQLVSS